MSQTPTSQGGTAVQRIHFPKPFAHAHPPVVDVNQIDSERLTPGQRAADRVAAIVGSWRFIIVQSVLLVAWAWLNL